jgi:hypothetical protein
MTLKQTFDAPRFQPDADPVDVAKGAYEVTDADWTEIGEDGLFYHGCCDCGLSHAVEVRRERGKTFIQFRRSERLTTELRKRQSREDSNRDA